MVPQLPAELGSWMRDQRWYASKGSTPQLERRGGWSLDAGDARIETHFVLDRQRSGATLYQVPLTSRAEPLEDVPVLWKDGDRFIYDAPHDPAYARAILGLINSETAAGDARGHHQPGARRASIDAISVLRGEQSNTSIICATDDGAPIMLKVFRALHAGDNPDVVIQSALSSAGSALVPASVGYLSGQWDDPAEPDGVARGHLAFAQDFLAGAEDGWRLALLAAASGHDFSARARELGRDTAEMHRALGEVLGKSETNPTDVDRFVTAMRGRAAVAIAEVPELGSASDRITAVVDAAASVSWPPLQRIHGDYHLGQVLGLEGSVGWIIIDFEGEPLRSMRERSAEDIPLRDVAGMVRSFDYVAGAVAREGAAETSRDAVFWSLAARQAFLAGYSEVDSSALQVNTVLLAAFELDKALYEAVYEVRNRPDWLPIPLAAIRALIGS